MSYFQARIARILPLYYLTTLMVASVGIFSLLRHGTRYVGDGYISILLQNLFLVSGVVNGSVNTINVPAWSVSVEVFCYLLIFPLLVWLNARLDGRRLMGPFLVVLIVTSATLLALANESSNLSLRLTGTDLSFLARGIFGFTAGFGCASIRRLLHEKSYLPSTSGRWLACSGLLFLLGQGGFINMPLDLLTVAIVFFSSYDQGLLARLLKADLFLWLGERSYSLYLWHFPVILVMATYQVEKRGIPQVILFGLIVLIVMLLSEVSYRYFETPCRGWIRRLGARKETAMAPDRVAT